MSNSTITRHEVSVDTDIAAAFKKFSSARSKVEQLRKSREWTISHGRTPTRQDEDRFEQACVAVDDAKAELDVEQERFEGWSRFFLVTNNGGHIHRSMNCSTCFVTTEYAWLPELSGLTEEDAVEAWGGILCSICFPSAPVEHTNGENKVEAERKALDAALKAIAKSPEGKKVKTARELVASKQYRIGRHEGALERFNEDVRNGDTRDMPVFVARDAQRAEEELPKLRKQLDRAEVKLAAAEAALDAALEVK